MTEFLKRVIALLETYCYQQQPRSIEIEEYLTGVYRGAWERQDLWDEAKPVVDNTLPEPEVET